MAIDFKDWLSRLEVARINGDRDALFKIQSTAYQEKHSQPASDLEERFFFEYVYQSAYCARIAMGHRLDGDVTLASSYESQSDRYEKRAKEVAGWKP